MKLSTAIMLGSTTCKMIPNDWNSCALGAAANAIGIPQATPKSMDFSEGQRCPDGSIRLSHIYQAWPWLEGELLQSVWQMFDNEVCKGTKTLEQLADHVRSIEPQCGECNMFKCSCSPASLDSKVEAQEAVCQL